MSKDTTLGRDFAEALGRKAYRFRGRSAGEPFVVEQQAYYTEQGGKINWMRVLCSGFRPG
jgi:hypothetical protein